MFNNKTITMMRKLLSEAFPNIEEHERKKMLETLINKHPNSRLFCTMNGKHIARVGVEYPLKILKHVFIMLLNMIMKC